MKCTNETVTIELKNGMRSFCDDAHSMVILTDI